MAKRFILNAGRSSRQGELISGGKDNPEYTALTSAATMNLLDMAEIGVADGDKVRLRSSVGEADFRCRAGNVPPGMIFVVYGPPTCRLVDAATDGVGVPISKGIEVEIEPMK